MTHINLILALLAYRATADMSEMSEALRAHLSEAGLPTDGNRKVLEARWKAHSKRKAEAIIHRIITLPDAVTSTEDIATLCANTLRAEINTATLYSEDGKMRWANGRALTTLETMDSLREDVEKFKDEIQTQNDKIEDQTQQIEGLQDKIKIQDDKIEDQNHKMEGLQNTIKNQNDKIDDLQDIIKTQNVKIEDLEDVIKNQNDIIKKQNDRIEGLENMIKTQNDKIEGLIQDIKDLKATNGQQALKIGRLDSICKALLKSRCRFFAMYKRDKKPRLMTPQDYTQIEEGNEAVHFGDPLLDAFMFEEKVREDILIYIDLYGLAFTQVLSIRESPVVLLCYICLHWL